MEMHSDGLEQEERDDRAMVSWCSFRDFSIDLITESVKPPNITTLSIDIAF
jgi:hypothetical protein